MNAICFHRGYPTMFAPLNAVSAPDAKAREAGFCGYRAFAASAAGRTGDYSRLMPAAATAAA